MLFDIRMRGATLMVGIITSMMLAFETFMFHSKYTLSPFLPDSKFPVLEEIKFRSKVTSISMGVSNPLLFSDPQNSTYSVKVLKEVAIADVSDMRGESYHGFNTKGTSGYTEKDNASDDNVGQGEDVKSNKEYSSESEGAVSKKITNAVGDSFAILRVVDGKFSGSLKEVKGLLNDSKNLSKHGPTLVYEQKKILGKESASLPITYIPAVSKDARVNMASIITSSKKNTDKNVASSKKGAEKFLKHDALMSTQSASSTSNPNSTGTIILWVKKKMPPVYISEMNSLLLRNRASDPEMRPQWSSSCDMDILAAKEQIESAPIVKYDQALYAPLFRNISKFKRSYDLMEQTVKIYVYKQGKKPIFHQSLLSGIYSSEGWFMKLMKTNKHFVVKDPRKAHLFYMPFSSRYLQSALYIPESHNWIDLEQYLKNYVDMIAASYPFWNRSGGADHFLVACHDWAPFETRHAMEHSIRALCTADLRSGFHLGKDVSLPQTNVRSPINPLEELGGRPANRRHTLAFFAGSMHGSLRPKLLRHWENKYDSMKIFGLLPGGVKERKTAYIQYMKTSKYCICPKGHEANSPRVVESILYECVPVIISDNYVPPFFEVLNWEAFSVILRERDIPRLKEILESIPEATYLALQIGVRKAQKHFLWHNKPVKYDLFHMILHSIWFNRVYYIG